MKKSLLILFLFTSGIFAQTLSFEKCFGNFRNASSFDIDLNYNFYVLDKDSSIIIKLDSLGTVKNSIGGYGWEESTFDEPVDIFTNTLSVYVADKNNNRVQRFDKDLNFLSQYIGTDENNNNVEFNYPTCVAISTIGDLFILDSDNSRILKFNLSGEYILELGGNDAGEFSIDNPKYFTTDNNGNIYILDEENIKVFDQYGNGLLKFHPIIDADKINITNNYLLLNNTSEIAIYDLKNNKLIFVAEDLQNFNNDDLIIKSKLLNTTLYVLTQKKIYKYKLRF
jgi:hypothetical protein